MPPIFESESAVRAWRVPLGVGLWALAGAGLYGASRCWLLDDAWVINAMRGSAVLMAVCLWAWFRSAHRRSTGLGVLLFENAWLGFVLVAFPLCLWPCWAVLLNGHGDTSPLLRQQALVVAKAQVFSFRTRGVWKASLQDGRVPGKLVPFNAAQGNPWVHGVEPGDRVWLSTRAGRLGWAWRVQESPVRAELDQ